MEKLDVGFVHTLTVLRKIDTGYVLQKEASDVLLHKNEITADLEEGQQVKVFLYQDKKGQVVASMTIPTVRADTYDWAEVVEVVKDLGVFVKIGLARDFLVSIDDLPKIERVWPQVGDMLYVTLDKDKQDKMIAKPITEGVFEGEWETAPQDINHKPISGRIYRTDREGSVILTEEGYRGFIHNSERKEEPRLGEWVKGRVIDIKEDGTINVSLRPLKQVGMVEDADEILTYLEDHDGVIPFTDKSSPADIDATFKISKAAFKRALGKLMKEGKIEQKDGKTYLKH
ncbi:S1 RNA-binding domain-containing protein [Radiobacillus sp. PE A8.2]|uniref:CvfB family protein n=1 Tax=Radiobacillus sp. PE A8.2 TaxID=3380349 RepID=UPI003890DB66